MAIELERFRPDTLVGCNLYLRQGNDGHNVLYKRKGVRVMYQDIERLMSNNVRSLYVDAEDEHIIRNYLEDNLSHYLETPDKPVDKKSHLLYECATHRVKEVLENPKSSENVRRSKVIVENMVNYVFSETKALHSLMKIMSYDYYTYTHSVNVCTFCVALARFSGEKNRSVLREIGLGALVHDVGKVRIPEEITTKREPLSEEEMGLMKKHPLFGLEIVRESMSLSRNIEAIITQHHEKCNGTGYPFGKMESEIHRYAKLTCIADIFDALTTRRPYRRALRTFPALKLMKDEMDGELDINFFINFVYLLKK